MTEFSGTVEGVGLPAIIRFLAGLKKSGCLRIAEGGWQGEIFFDEGQVLDARLGSRSGLAVVDALVETLPRASFALDSQAQLTREPSIRLSPDAFQAHLDELSRRVARDASNLLRPDAVPVLRNEQEEVEDSEALSLDRGTLKTLLAIDGKRTVGDIVAQRGTFEALWQIGSLIEAGVVALRSTSAVPGVSEPVGQRQVVAESSTPPPAVDSAALEQVARCPKLGFEDDANSSFNRPTRLHRCFAAGTPMPLSLDQQRELCLSDHFSTCPRLTPTVPANAEPDDSRILRIPFGSRGPAPARDAAGTPRPEPTFFRATDAAAATVAHGERPRPLRAGFEPAISVQASAAAPRFESPASWNASQAVGAPSAMLALHAPARVEAPAAHVAARAPQVQLGALAERQLPVRRVGIVAGALLALAFVAAGAFMYSGQLSGSSSDVDPASRPNAGPVAVGTPVSAQANPSRPPTPLLVSAQSAPAPRPSSKVLFDEPFTTNSANWPSSPRGTSALVDGSYHVATQRDGQFVAIGAPITNLPADVIVSATFHKVAGPAGGGYGIIVRDQATGTRDGTSQDGRYYVLEVGDKGEVGMWRRESDHWVDLMTWQPADAVKPGTAANELTVRAVGNTLSLTVNGTQVATRTDNSFASGGAGLFVGGDGNQVAVDHFSIRTP